MGVHDTTRRRLVLGAGATLVAGLWFWRRRGEDTNMAATEVQPALRRRAIGLLRFLWIPYEAEAPAVASDAPFGSADAFADLAVLAGSSGPAGLKALYAAAMSALPTFVATAAPRLPPGPYRLDAADTARLRRWGDTLANVGWAPGLAHDLGVAADGTVGYTREHALVLPHLRWQLSPPDTEEPLRPDAVAPRKDGETGTTWPVIVGNPKRPYGDSTNAEYDMARALGLEMSVKDGINHLEPAIVARLTALHLTMPAALRVLVVYGNAD